MIDPDYAINFLNITTQVTATILGFTIIFFVFWYENIGKFLKLELDTRSKGFHLIKYYNKFERTFLLNFLNSDIPFTKRKYKDIFRITKLDFLYVKIKNKTKMFGYTYPRLNYKIFLSTYAFMFLIGIGVLNILENTRFLYGITKFTEEQLTNDPTFPPIIDNSSDRFILFMIIFFAFIFLIIFYSLERYKKKKLSDRWNEIEDIY